MSRWYRDRPAPLSNKIGDALPSEEEMKDMTVTTFEEAMASEAPNTITIPSELWEEVQRAIETGADRETCKHYECCGYCGPIYACEAVQDKIRKWKEGEG